MCFAPQRRALFPHPNFQKSSEPDMFWHFLLPHVLQATRACTFSTSQLPKVLRAWCALPLFTSNTMACNFSSLIWPAGSAPAALASLLFDPPEPQNIGKTLRFATCLPFRATASSLFWLSPPLIFSISYLLPSDFLHGWASSWLCFSICPYCRKFSFQTSFDNSYMHISMHACDYICIPTYTSTCICLCTSMARLHPVDTSAPLAPVSRWASERSWSWMS